MVANNSKSYFAYLKKLIDQYYNTYHPFINKKPINAERQILKLLSLKLMIKSELPEVSEYF